MHGHPRKNIENQLPLPELLARAGQGDADCQYWAGIRYFQGEGVPENPRRAVELCADAARQFHLRAIAFIAYCRYQGIVVPKDVKTAILLYRFAAAPPSTSRRSSAPACRQWHATSATTSAKIPGTRRQV